MKRIALVTLFLALAHGFLPDALRGDDIDKLKGSWRVVEDHFNGVRFQGDSSSVGEIISFEGDTIVFPNDETNKPEKLKYALDTKKRPKHIDWTVRQAGENLPYRGIYALQGDRLTICMAIDDKRPTRLKTTKGSDWVMVVLTRIKVKK